MHVLFTQLLSNRGVHVIDHGDRDDQWGAHFLVGCEMRTSDDDPVGDYYQEFLREYVDGNGVIQNAFGIRTWVNDLLERNNLFAEWINAAVFGVYDI